MSAVSAVVALLPAVDPAPYTPANLGTDLAASLVQILPYVGVAVGASLGIMFALIGIKKGISWARSLTAKG